MGLISPSNSLAECHSYLSTDVIARDISLATTPPILLLRDCQVIVQAAEYADVFDRAAACVPSQAPVSTAQIYLLLLLVSVLYFLQAELERTSVKSTGTTKIQQSSCNYGCF